MPLRIVIHNQNMITAFSAFAHKFILKRIAGDMITATIVQVKKNSLRGMRGQEHMIAIMCRNPHILSKKYTVPLLKISL